MQTNPTNLLLSIIALIISSIGTIIIGISAILLWKQIKGNHEWNRRKTSKETLDSLVVGEFPKLRDEFEKSYSVWDKNKNYEEVIKGLAKENVDKIDLDLRKLLNFFETITISIKNHIIDEDICYDFFGYILTEYYRWSKPFIQKKRESLGDLRVYADFEKYAINWAKRIEVERKKMVNSALLKGKDKL